MKHLPLVLATLLIFSTAHATETQARIGNRDVNIITDQSPDSPKACHAARLEHIKKGGWHDEIYNSASDEKAYLVYSQRVVDGGVLSKMKVTFWKAIKTPDGKTSLEEQVYLISRAELTGFLDTEIRPLFLKFSQAH